MGGASFLHPAQILHSPAHWVGRADRGPLYERPDTEFMRPPDRTFPGSAGRRRQLARLWWSGGATYPGDLL